MLSFSGEDSQLCVNFFGTNAIYSIHTGSSNYPMSREQSPRKPLLDKKSTSHHAGAEGKKGQDVAIRVNGGLALNKTPIHSFGADLLQLAE